MKKSSHQLRKMIFALLNFIYDGDCRFKLMSKECLNFLFEFMKRGDDLGIYADRNQYDLTHYDTWRRCLLVSLSLPVSLADKTITTYELFEIFETIRIHAVDNGINLDEFIRDGDVKKVNKMMKNKE